MFKYDVNCRLSVKYSEHEYPVEDYSGNSMVEVGWVVVVVIDCEWLTSWDGQEV